MATNVYRTENSQPMVGLLISGFGALCVERVDCGPALSSAAQRDSRPQGRDKRELYSKSGSFSDVGLALRVRRA